MRLPTRLTALLFAALGLGCLNATAQTLPPHPPLRILILSDEVNPHGLLPAQLTQPGEISAALAGAPALNLDSGAEALLELPTNSIEQATSRLLRAASDPLAYDVLIYFSHRIPDDGNKVVARQEAFVAAVQQFLQQGGGVVSFHHGIYLLPGKESMQSLLGAQASGAVFWNTVEGQNVINVGAEHFVSSNGIAYPNVLSYADPANGIAAGNYPAFNNTPDERYPTLARLPVGGFFQPLFASNYNQNGTQHLLGYQLRQPAWQGVVIVYQPGEYQPNALTAGNNFQILLNAIWYSAGFARWPVFASGFE
jgi:hypothetical protein